MIIYNLFPLLAGKFADWKPHMERAADLGFEWIFVNPIQYPGYSGSLYSIKDYFRLNHLLIDDSNGTPPAEQFKEIAGFAHERGLKLMVDLVISHCAFDSDLTKEHPNWFEHDHGKIAHPFCWESDGRKVVWRDLAKFDHKKSKDKEGLFRYLLQTVDFLIELGFDGFRCDAAYQVPADFWKRLISETRKKHPKMVFLAETLGCSPHETAATAAAGFDCIFNSSKWWDMQGSWLLEQYSLTREVACSVSFPESHDTRRLADETDGNVACLKQRYLLAALFSAGTMMPIGYEFGFRKKLHVVETRPTDWETINLDLTDFIRRTNRIKTSNPIFLEEAPTEMLGCNNPNVLFLWKGSLRAGQEALLILNRDIHNKQHFHSQNLYDHVQSKGPLTDVSPEFPLDYLPTPFEYGLAPGQGIVLVNGK